MKLKSIGFTEKEYLIYELLLSNGSLTGGEVIHKTKLKRSTVYKSLHNLRDKGLIIETEENKKLIFKPESPDKLLSVADQKYNELERTRSDVMAVLPNLMDLFQLNIKKPVVTTFQGIEGLKKIYLDTIREAKPIYAILQTSEVEPSLYKWLNEYYAKLRKKNNIPAHVIVSSGKWSREYINKVKDEGLGSTVLVPSKIFPFEHEVDIYGDKVAFINYKKGGSLIGIIIHNELIAKTMKALYDLALQGAININK